MSEDLPPLTEEQKRLAGIPFGYSRCCKEALYAAERPYPGRDDLVEIGLACSDCGKWPDRPADDWWNVRPVRVFLCGDTDG